MKIFEGILVFFAIFRNFLKPDRGMMLDLKSRIVFRNAVISKKIDMYYISLYHTHKFAISLFLIIYLFKMILLFSGKARLEKSSSRIKVPEIIISTLFLLTGILLLFEAAEIRNLFIIKIATVVLAIPIAFKAYKSHNRPLALLSFIMLIGAYGLAEMNKYNVIHQTDLPGDVVVDASNPEYDMISHGRALYNTQCVVCHGKDGRLQMSGAKKLTISVMSKEEIITRINTGKMTMPSYEDHFTDHEKKAITDYVISVRK